MLLHSLLALILSLVSFSPIRADQGCAALLASPLSSNRPPPDQAFQAYFSDLLQETVLGTEELVAYKKNLEAGKIVNPITDQVALMKDGAWVHQDSLQRHIDGGGLSITAQLKWANEKLEEREHNKERQRLAEIDTRKMLLPQAYSFVKMIPIAGGSFTMGSPESEAGRYENENQVEVELSPFEIMDAPATQQLWVEVMEENPSRFQERKHCRKNHKVIGDVQLCPDLPVENVSWNDIQIFIKKLNRGLGFVSDNGYRLPTEAEWEYAARAGTTTAYFFGNKARDLKKFAVHNKNRTRPVRSKRPNPWGLYDVHGNVWEWVQDLYGEKLIGGKDPVGTSSGINRVFRGGGWIFAARLLRSAHRSNYRPSYGDPGFGFRLARTINERGVPLLDHARDTVFK